MPLTTAKKMMTSFQNPPSFLREESPPRPIPFRALLSGQSPPRSPIKAPLPRALLNENASPSGAPLPPLAEPSPSGSPRKKGWRLPPGAEVPFWHPDAAPRGAAYSPNSAPKTPPRSPSKLRATVPLHPQPPCLFRQRDDDDDDDPPFNSFPPSPKPWATETKEKSSIMSPTVSSAETSSSTSPSLGMMMGPALALLTFWALADLFAQNHQNFFGPGASANAAAGILQQHLGFALLVELSKLLLFCMLWWACGGSAEKEERATTSSPSYSSSDSSGSSSGGVVSYFAAMALPALCYSLVIGATAWIRVSEAAGSSGNGVLPPLPIDFAPLPMDAFSAAGCALGLASLRAGLPGWGSEKQEQRRDHQQYGPTWIFSPRQIAALVFLALGCTLLGHELMKQEQLQGHAASSGVAQGSTGVWKLLGLGLVLALGLLSQERGLRRVGADFQLLNLSLYLQTSMLLGLGYLLLSATKHFQQLSGQQPPAPSWEQVLPLLVLQVLVGFLVPFVLRRADAVAAVQLAGWRQLGVGAGSMILAANVSVAPLGGSGQAFAHFVPPIYSSIVAATSRLDGSSFLHLGEHLMWHFGGPAGLLVVSGFLYYAPTLLQLLPISSGLRKFCEAAACSHAGANAFDAEDEAEKGCRRPLLPQKPS